MPITGSGRIINGQDIVQSFWGGYFLTYPVVISLMHAILAVINRMQTMLTFTMSCISDALNNQSSLISSSSIIAYKTHQLKLLN